MIQFGYVINLFYIVTITSFVDKLLKCFVMFHLW